MAELKPEEIDKAVEEPTVPRAEEARLVEELRRMEYQPLMPVEKKLIGWSLAIGVALIGILIWVSYTFFPAQ
jgi:hypothetical protein